ncbi:MAG: nucleotidyl transferase AbiEii/AbiGii toxin family protein [Rhodospirillaceae bacterium]|nr:nucleotidyl transferase AbiEii/AbiGii toxin family protein [Rhodospirillaceae bacterium]
MPRDYLHAHKDFRDLIGIVARDLSIDPALVEKDYWLMQGLYGLQQMGLSFELKGGTSLSKGFGLISRFSEDIDIHIAPPTGFEVNVGRNHVKPAHVKSRQDYYDYLAANIKIAGIAEISRDTDFDDTRQYRSGGIRLAYDSVTTEVAGLKQGILLEVGFDDIAPNVPRDITSWAYDYAAPRVEIIDNRAKGVLCYQPGFTLVEKLQTISTKYRKEQETGDMPRNFMRHYYDVYSLLDDPDVQAFIGTNAYVAHKAKRFPAADNQVIAENEAFRLSDLTTRAGYEKAYLSTKALYYRAQPPFSDILAKIQAWSPKL